MFFTILVALPWFYFSRFKKLIFLEKLATFINEKTWNFNFVFSMKLLNNFQLWSRGRLYRKKHLWVFMCFKFWSVSPNHFIKHRSLISEKFTISYSEIETSGGYILLERNWSEFLLFHEKDFFSDNLVLPKAICVLLL